MKSAPLLLAGMASLASAGPLQPRDLISQVQDFCSRVAEAGGDCNPSFDACYKKLGTNQLTWEVLACLKERHQEVAASGQPPAAASTSKPPHAAASTSQPPAASKPSQQPAAAKLPWKPQPWTKQVVQIVGKEDKLSEQDLREKELFDNCYRAFALDETLCGTDVFCNAFDQIDVLKQHPKLKDYKFDYASQAECLQHHDQPPKPAAQASSQPLAQASSQPLAQASSQPPAAANTSQPPAAAKTSKPPAAAKTPCGKPPAAAAKPSQATAAAQLPWKPAPWSADVLAKQYPNLSDEEKLSKEMQLKRECYGEAVIDETLCGTDIFCEPFKSIEECRQAAAAKPSQPPAAAKLPWKPAPWSDEVLAEQFPNLSGDAKFDKKKELNSKCFDHGAPDETRCGTEIFCRGFDFVETDEAKAAARAKYQECTQKRDQPPRQP